MLISLETMHSVAAIGAGGKTTALGRLAVAHRQQRVLLTTTTRIRPYPDTVCDRLLIDPSPQELAEALAQPGVTCAGCTSQEGKLRALSPELLELGCEKAQLVLYEADGAKMLPLKLHRSFEPVMLPHTDLCLVVAGLSAQAARPYCDKAAAETGVTYELTERGDDLHILCKGKGAHASTPEEGVNAITGLIHLLCALPLAKVGSTAALHALNALFPHGDSAGKALGIAQADEMSGPLTLAFSLLELNDTGLSGQFDSRVPVCANEDNCKAVAEAAFAKFGFAAEGGMQAPHYTPADTPLVTTLLKCYEQYSGRKGECLAIGGGTYVHDIPGGVAFGCAMPGFNGNMHGPDEHTCIADQLTAAKIFAQAIIDLCG